jgi:DNA-binding transcriptional LysR family regulator
VNASPQDVGPRQLFIVIETPMDTLESMRMFVRVVEAGSFTKAASLASVKVPWVSRAIADLELRQHTRLLNRTTRHLSLTEAGRHYLQHCEQILAQIEIAEAQAVGASVQPCGKLRIHANTSFGQHYLAPMRLCSARVVC